MNSRFFLIAAMTLTVLSAMITAPAARADRA